LPVVGLLPPGNRNGPIFRGSSCAASATFDIILFVSSVASGRIFLLFK
jgi:hypothetical protein